MVEYIGHSIETPKGLYLSSGIKVAQSKGNFISALTKLKIDLQAT